MCKASLQHPHLVGDTIVVSKTSATKKQTTEQISKPTQKNAFEQKFGEGTAFDLDYGKLLIIALCVYIAVKVS